MLASDWRDKIPCANNAPKTQHVVITPPALCNALSAATSWRLHSSGPKKSSHSSYAHLQHDKSTGRRLG